MALKPYRFEIGATIGFTVLAESEADAVGKADAKANELFADHALNFPVEVDVWVAVDEATPDLIERPEDQHPR